MLETAPVRSGPLKDKQGQKVMVGLRRRRSRDQGLTLTLELLRQAPDAALLIDDLEDSGV
jgi:hypothetical protein